MVRIASCARMGRIEFVSRAPAQFLPRFAQMTEFVIVDGGERAQAVFVASPSQPCREQGEPARQRVPRSRCAGRDHRSRLEAGRHAGRKGEHRGAPAYSRQAHGATSPMAYSATVSSAENSLEISTSPGFQVNRSLKRRSGLFSLRRTNRMSKRPAETAQRDASTATCAVQTLWVSRTSD